MCWRTLFSALENMLLRPDEAEEDEALSSESLLKIDATIFFIVGSRPADSEEVFEEEAFEKDDLFTALDCCCCCGVCAEGVLEGGGGGLVFRA